MQFTLIGEKKYSLENVAKPEIKDKQNLVRVKACGICGSDIPRLFNGKVYHYPLVIGHEFSGIIEDSYDKSNIGKRVCVFPIKPCFACESCHDENYANCQDYDYYGSRCDGGMQDYVVCDDFNLIEIPNGISYDSAAMIEPCAVTLHAIKKSGIDENSVVRVFGAGTIGLLCCMWAKVFGAKEVTVSDIDKNKLDFAQKLGFVGESTQAPNVIIEASGSSTAINSALDLIKPFGKIVLVGNASKDVSLSVSSYSKILRKQISVLGSWNSDYKHDVNDWTDSVNAIASKKMQPELLITHRYQLKDILSAIDMIEGRQEMFNKIMVEM